MRMKLIVGLGNPGSEYASTRHNVGWMVIDKLAEQFGARAWQGKFKGRYSASTIDGAKVGFLKPETFMNLSGESVRAAMDFFKITPADVIVIHDELDLDFGDIRTKVGGGTAGHNGLKSIKQHLGTLDFARVRFGVGHPSDKNRVSSYVLNDFSKEEAPQLPDLLGDAAKATATVLEKLQ